MGSIDCEHHGVESTSEEMNSAGEFDVPATGARSELDSAFGKTCWHRNDQMRSVSAVPFTDDPQYTSNDFGRDDDDDGHGIAGALTPMVESARNLADEACCVSSSSTSSPATDKAPKGDGGGVEAVRPRSCANQWNTDDNNNGDDVDCTLSSRDGDNHQVDATRDGEERERRPSFSRDDDRIIVHRKLLRIRHIRKLQRLHRERQEAEAAALAEGTRERERARATAVAAAAAAAPARVPAPTARTASLHQRSATLIGRVSFSNRRRLFLATPVRYYSRNANIAGDLSDISRQLFSSTCLGRSQQLQQQGENYYNRYDACSSAPHRPVHSCYHIPAPTLTPKGEDHVSGAPAIGIQQDNGFPLMSPVKLPKRRRLSWKYHHQC